jgi:hypothetical protein
MSMISVCDGCGKQAPAVAGNHSWHKPPDWFERTEPNTGEILTACSRGCVDRVHEKRKAEGKPSTNVVLPL